MGEDKTQEELRAELYAKLRSQNGAEHLCEVATPGVVRPVQPEVRRCMDNAMESIAAAQ